MNTPNAALFSTKQLFEYKLWANIICVSNAKWLAQCNDYFHSMHTVLINVPTVSVNFCRALTRRRLRIRLDEVGGGNAHR